MISYAICLPLKSEPQKSTYICINANNTCNSCFMRVFLNRPALKTVTVKINHLKNYTWQKNTEIINAKQISWVTVK